ncbi:MAG: hypothetical protein ABEJ59_03840 [Halanaeroarchaeum sp.]
MPAKTGSRGVEDGLGTIVTYAATGLSRMVAREVHNPGTPIRGEEWDVLLVLDACRVDLMPEVADEYAFLPAPEDLETRWSVASMSSDWLRRTFAAEYESDVAETAYVTGNAFTKDDVFAVEPAHLDEVWTDAWDEDVNTIRPQALTDRAVDTWRDRPGGVESMVVHYMQPHVPFVANPDPGEYTRPEDFGRGFADVWVESATNSPARRSGPPTGRTSATSWTTSHSSWRTSTPTALPSRPTTATRWGPSGSRATQAISCSRQSVGCPGSSRRRPTRGATNPTCSHPNSLPRSTWRRDWPTWAIAD